MKFIEKVVWLIKDFVDGVADVFHDEFIELFGRDE